ncbi:annexin A2-like [Hyperolius riggenbachi]|uniref:annexin A2-like n=1 Tax=Hyperolius riggenbachi TaxID=752182 RepID=UPI0035A3CC37
MYTKGKRDGEEIIPGPQDMDELEVGDGELCHTESQRVDEMEVQDMVRMYTDLRLCPEQPHRTWTNRGRYIGADTTHAAWRALLPHGERVGSGAEDRERHLVLTSDLGPKNSPNIAQWITIFTERPKGHLRRVFDSYKKITSEDIEDGIKKHFKGDLQKALFTLVAVIKDTPLYFADKLHNSMKGLGTDDKALIRILISRSEEDLLSIRVAYRKKYGKSLYSSIQSDTKGDYRMALLLLCRAEDI